MISWQKLEELYKKGYDLNIIDLLDRIKNGDDITTTSSKINNIISSLVRKGLYSEITKKLTITGDEILSFYSSPDEEKLVKKQILKKEDFDTWWSIFPPSDSFMYKGKKFTGCRGLRSDKEGCKLKFKSILNTGEFTAEEIIRSTKYDIFGKKENSYKTGQNKLSYLQNSKTYLNQLSFSAFIEESKNFEEKEVSTIVNGMDI